MEYDVDQNELICRNVECPPDSPGSKDFMSFNATSAPASIDITCQNYDNETGECVGIAGISMSLADFRILEKYVNQFFRDNNG